MKLLASAAVIAAMAGVAQATIYFSDFESNDGGLSGSGDWEYGSPNGFAGAPFGGAEPIGGNSGDFAWGTVIGGAHNPALTSKLTLAGLDLTNATELRYFEFLDSGGNTFDMAKVFVGATEVSLRDGGPTNGWREVVIDLTGFSGVQNITWDFTTTTVVERVGWYIDDVAVIPAPGAAAVMGLAGLAAVRRRR